jgi:hypothetical protein
LTPLAVLGAELQAVQLASVAAAAAVAVHPLQRTCLWPAIPHHHKEQHHRTEQLQAAFWFTRARTSSARFPLAPTQHTIPHT